jgi:hypothetical protein
MTGSPQGTKWKGHVLQSRRRGLVQQFNRCYGRTSPTSHNYNLLSRRKMTNCWSNVVCRPFATNACNKLLTGSLTPGHRESSQVHILWCRPMFRNARDNEVLRIHDDKLRSFKTLANSVKNNSYPVLRPQRQADNLVREHLRDVLQLKCPEFKTTYISQEEHGTYSCKCIHPTSTSVVCLWEGTLGRPVSRSTTFDSPALRQEAGFVLGVRWIHAVGRLNPRP